MSEDDDIEAADWWKAPTRRDKQFSHQFSHQWYVLNANHDPVPVHDLMEWSRFFENAEARRVAQTSIHGLWVSTVFLGLDHGWSGGQPILFETMIFRDEKHAPPEIYFEQIQNWAHDYQMRYATWDEAVRGHETVVTTIREGLF